MLSTIFPDPLARTCAQAVVAALAALAVALVARRRGIRVERELAVALVRGIVQITAVGSVLLLMLKGPTWTSIPALVAMVVAAAWTAASRARKVPGARTIALTAIAAGAGTVVALMTVAGVVETRITMLVPVGSMLIANAMNATGQALERFRSDLAAHSRLVEAALALGAAPEVAVHAYARSSFRASLMPAIDSLRSLGIVWIPGLMTGMVLSGTPPVRAAVYQFVTIAMMFASTGLSCLVATTLAGRRVFSPAAQLTLREGNRA